MERKENEFEGYCYQIRISGHLDNSWAAWLDCASIILDMEQEYQIPITVLNFPVTDQSALRGLLNKLFDLNWTLLSVNRCSPDADTNKIHETKE